VHRAEQAEQLGGALCGGTQRREQVGLNIGIVIVQSVKYYYYLKKKKISIVFSF
jgi:hypothetical protein